MNYKSKIEEYIRRREERIAKRLKKLSDLELVEKRNKIIPILEGMEVKYNRLIHEIGLRKDEKNN